MRLDPVTRFGGEVTLPGDKSISHRALLFSALSGGGRVRGIADGEDVRSTRRCLERLGVGFRAESDALVIEGTPRASSDELDCGNSGSTMRMLMGVLAGRPGRSRLTGDASLSRRPMQRVALPLVAMGARIELHEGRFAPVEVEGRPLHGITYRLPVASAQVKTAVILAALGAEGVTELEGEVASRDHTERLLPHFGAELEITPGRIRVRGGKPLHPATVDVPGDPSSAAFWAAAAAIVPGGQVVLRGVSLNPTRTGFLRALRAMGADVQESPRQAAPEPFGDIIVRHAPLRGISVKADEVPSMVDELPLLAVVAAYAEGTTEVRGAAELRLKESDRIDAIARNLKAMGGAIETEPDGFRVRGGRLRGAALDSFHDHRIAMAVAVAALRAEGASTLTGASCVAVSYPTFFETLASLVR